MATLAVWANLIQGTAAVLSTQALLVAVGVGTAAVPVSAALNWVIKDGLGQFGGVVFGSLVGNKFDSEPKRWRVVSCNVAVHVCLP